MANLELSGKKFKKVQSIKQLLDCGLPTPETIFILNFKKQEKEIDSFLRNREYVMIRSDASDGPDFCPHNLRCPRKEAKKFIKNLNLGGYAVILQEHIPWTGNTLVSGNILILENYFVVEMMKGGKPLIVLNRDGEVDEYLKIKIRKEDMKEIERLGKRLIKMSRLKEILKMVNRISLYSIVEFSIGRDWLYFWQIREDKSAQKLEL